MTVIFIVMLNAVKQIVVAPNLSIKSNQNLSLYCLMFSVSMHFSFICIPSVNTIKHFSVQLIEGEAE
jgi:hypothetical protein